MKLTQFSTLFIIALMLWTPVQAGDNKIYRTRDADGNVIFSDHATDGAKEVKVAKPITYKPEKITQKLSPPKSPEPEPFHYNRLVIVSPATDEAIRSNNGNLIVAFNLSPPLQANHSAALLIDGTVIQTTKTASRFEIENMDRGTHSIQIHITDDTSGKLIKSSDTRNTTILRYSILLNPRDRHSG